MKSRLLAGLILIDFMFIGIHLLRLTPLLDTTLLSIGKDLGLPEIFQYLKEGGIALMLFILYRKTREPGYEVWSLLFLYLLLDDAMQFHENIGRFVSEFFEFFPQGGLRASDFGELMVSAVVAAVLLVPLAVCFMKSGKLFRLVSIDLSVMLFILVLFGICFDMLEVMLMNHGLFICYCMGTIEDGGEMIVMSFIAVYVWFLFKQEGRCAEESSA